MKIAHANRGFDWKLFCLCLCFVITLGAATFSLYMIIRQQQTLTQIQSYITILSSNITNGSVVIPENESVHLLDYYISLSDKADNTIDRIIAVAATVFGISSLSGLFLAFKAPRDIERSMDSTKEDLSKVQSFLSTTEEKLRAQVSDASSSAENAKKSAEEAKRDASDAKFEVLLHEATDEFSSSDIKVELTKLMEKYPNKLELYLHRARHCSSIEQALPDLEKARELGLPDNQYFNEVAILYANNGKMEQAIEQFTQSLNRFANSTSVLINRGKCFCELGEQVAEQENIEEAAAKFDLALADFHAAESIGAKSAMLHLWRAFTYQNLKELCPNGSKIDYKLINSDIDEAYKIDYEKTSATLQVRSRKKQADDGMKSSRSYVATLLMKISLLQIQSGDEVAAFQSLIEAYGSVCLYAEDEETEQKVFSDIKKYIIEHSSPLIYKEHIVSSLSLFRSIGAAAYQEYELGRNLNAERLFRFIIDNCTNNEFRDYCINNFAYMIRRGEASLPKESALELIDAASNKSALILRLNRALATYFLGGSDDYAYSDALECLVGAEFEQNDLDEIVEWWSNLELVGKLESEIAFRLLSDSGVTKHAK